MRKNLLFIAMLLAFFPTVKAQYNLFDAADVDADGWLWFNTQAKIDKYVGEGKAIELLDASFDPFSVSSADPAIVGVGSDGKLAGLDAKTGALVLSPSAAGMTYNGGSILMYLPSCTSLNLNMSNALTMYPQVKGGVGKKDILDLANIKSYISFPKLSGAGQKKWENIQALSNIISTGTITLASTTPVTAQIINGTKSNMYVDGMKVLTSTPTSINNPTVEKFNPRYFNRELTLNQVASVKVFSVGGKLVAEETNSKVNLAQLDKGVYMVRIKNEDGEGCTKILVY